MTVTVITQGVSTVAQLDAAIDIADNEAADRRDGILTFPQVSGRRLA
jgi:hypothetical protein